VTVVEKRTGAQPDDRAAQSHAIGSSTQWYQDAVIYELHVRAFNDGNGDGIGDFRGLIGKLDYLQQLGVTAIWLLPFYPSPLRDDGYDISDYRRVHPSYGTLRDFRLFLREAHRRGLKVITELVLAHTSDQHPWFQRARAARAGTAQRDFYVWSDTPDRFREARIIFQDYETSNWSYDAEAGAYFWHRFYSHQPSLNYDNPAVRRAMFDVLDFWLNLGVDGLRLDAVPYLYAREGTSCENLPETLDFLGDLRAHVDAHFADRMLLAEANQWPEDAVEYMGNGDRCHMAFHFPLMPRMFMAARQEDRFPIVDILAETPAAPDGCQWALFLRNHDELTLEMVTDEERDYMVRAYAQDPQARVNMGIRRRLAPLLGNDRTMIEMMNGLLFSLPGTPILYYGDEIGMGDNIYLGDRDAVRTPMQWDDDRNAGFSKANPQRLYLPVVTDPGYHQGAVNVEAQDANPSSLLWWMRRLIQVRRRYKAFGRGSLDILRADNRKVLAFVRRYGDETILVVANLSRFPQCVELDLSEFLGAIPIELFGNMAFPPVGDLPYFVTLGGHGFYWFSLQAEPKERTADRSDLSVSGTWSELVVGSEIAQLERVLPAYIAEQRWFRSKTRTITAATLTDAIPVGGSRDGNGTPTGYLGLVRVDLDIGSPEQYLLPLGFATESRAEELCRWSRGAVVADVHVNGSAGVVFDAAWDAAFARAVVRMIGTRRAVPGSSGATAGVPTRQYRAQLGPLSDDVAVSLMTAEQSNTSVTVGDRAILKLFRRIEPGTNPGVEVGQFLTERAGFTNAPGVGGSLVYQRSRDGERTTLAELEAYVPNEGDGWSYVVDALGHTLEETLAHTGELELQRMPPAHPLDVLDEELPTGHLLLGPHVEWASLLGTRIGELHLALASDSNDAAFAPVPLTAADRQSLYHGARRLTRQVLRQLSTAGIASDSVNEVMSRETEILDRLRWVTSGAVDAQKIRCHGDCHLGQVLWTGKDFVLIDFEGEPDRSLAHRRLKRPAAFDLAGMVRSFHYASRAAAMRLNRDLTDSFQPAALEQWLDLWYRWVSGTFLGSYLDAVGNSPFVPRTRDQLRTLLDFFLLEKAVYELGYEANARPGWVDIPSAGILDVLDTKP
jgi:maltose alpha-D-glucosyltransferase / alpha-amylase